MLYEELIQRLRDPDQWVRVESLRILAMVEESRALREIEWVYKNDPEAGVRQVAQWAGRTIMAAQKQKAATGSHPVVPDKQAEAEDRLLSSLIDKDPRTYQDMQIKRMMLEVESQRRSTPTPEALPAHAPISAVPAVTQAAQPATPNTANLGWRELLDAGLSTDFFKDEAG